MPGSNLRREMMEKLFTAEELASILGVSIQTIYNRRSNGGSLPKALHIGRLVRYRQCDIDFWIGGLPRSSETLGEPQGVGPVMRTIRKGRPSKAEQVRRRKRYT